MPRSGRALVVSAARSCFALQGFGAGSARHAKSPHARASTKQRAGSTPAKRRSVLFHRHMVPMTAQPFKSAVLAQSPEKSTPPRTATNG